MPKETIVLKDAGMFSGLPADEALKILENAERMHEELDKKFAGQPSSRELGRVAIKGLKKLTGAAEEPTPRYGGVSGEMLRQIVSKIEKLEEEKREVSEYISDCYKEAKSQGFDSKVLRQLIKIRKLDAAELAEQEEVLDLYKHALGMAVSDEE